MNRAAYQAVEDLWIQTVKARALCPYRDMSAVGTTGYVSPPWYRQHGASYFVKLPAPLTSDDVEELLQIAESINRGFVISMVAVLEAYSVIPSGSRPDLRKNGGEHAQLTKWLRNHFAHGAWKYDANNSQHVKTRNLLVKLFPAAANEPGFDLSIDTILEPLKDGVLSYIGAVP